MMAFPKEKELAKIRKQLAKAQGTLMLPENPSQLQKLRWDITREFVKYALEHKLKSLELAKELGIHESEISRILHHRIDRFSTDKLISLLEKIRPNHKIQLKAA
jgi:predicted XRE-type DNA-binding protein